MVARLEKLGFCPRKAKVAPFENIGETSTKKPGSGTVYVYWIIDNYCIVDVYIVFWIDVYIKSYL